MFGYLTLAWDTVTRVEFHGFNFILYYFVSFSGFDVPLLQIQLTESNHPSQYTDRVVSLCTET